MDNETEDFLDFLMERMEAALEFVNSDEYSDSRKVATLGGIAFACKRRIYEHLTKQC